MEPKIYLSSDIYSSSIKVTASCVSGQNIRLCCNGNCQTGKEVTKNDVTLRREERLDLQFEYIEELDAGVEVPTVVTRISAEDIYDEESRVDFVLVMGVEGASLNKVETGADGIFGVSYRTVCNLCNRRHMRFRKHSNGRWGRSPAAGHLCI